LLKHHSNLALAQPLLRVVAIPRIIRVSVVARLFTSRALAVLEQPVIIRIDCVSRPESRLNGVHSFTYIVIFRDANDNIS
jgi:hypothetical protein